MDGEMEGVADPPPLALGDADALADALPLIDGEALWLEDGAGWGDREGDAAGGAATFFSSSSSSSAPATVGFPLILREITSFTGLPVQDSPSAQTVVAPVVKRAVTRTKRRVRRMAP